MHFLSRNSRRLGLQFILVLVTLITSLQHLTAQQPLSKGQEAQALHTEPHQGTQALPSATMSLHAQQQLHLKSHKAWETRLERHFAPQKPNRPIPVMLVLLGLLLVLLWTGLLIGAILATAVLGTILLIATIVLIPVLVVGIIFFIGGIASSTSSSKN
jgi:hypothetical protein